MLPCHQGNLCEAALLASIAMGSPAVASAPEALVTVSAVSAAASVIGIPVAAVAFSTPGSTTETLTVGSASAAAVGSWRVCRG